jgi:hypothetical protein
VILAQPRSFGTVRAIDIVEGGREDYAALEEDVAALELAADTSFAYVTPTMLRVDDTRLMIMAGASAPKLRNYRATR